MKALVGRVAAAVGVVAAFLGVWLAAIDAAGFSQSYWRLDGTLGAYLLVLAAICALLLLNTAVGWRGLDLGVAAVGAILFGTFLFFPATLAFDQLDILGVGAWLGVCSGLVALGAAAAYALADPARRRAATPRERIYARAIVLVGLGLVLAGMWLRVDSSNDGTYWGVRGAGHSLGILFLILIGLCVASLAVASATRDRMLDLAAAGAAFVLTGLVSFVPVSSAFNQLDTLRAGAWLCFAGGLVLAVGTALGWSGARGLLRTDSSALPGGPTVPPATAPPPAGPPV